MGRECSRADPYASPVGDVSAGPAIKASPARQRQNRLDYRIGTVTWSDGVVLLPSYK
jgi:hypothetical protein